MLKLTRCAGWQGAGWVSLPLPPPCESCSQSARRAQTRRVPCSQPAAPVGRAIPRGTQTRRPALDPYKTTPLAWIAEHGTRYCVRLSLVLSHPWRRRTQHLLFFSWCGGLCRERRTRTTFTEVRAASVLESRAVEGSPDAAKPEVGVVPTDFL